MFMKENDPQMDRGTARCGAQGAQKDHICGVPCNATVIIKTAEHVFDRLFYHYTDYEVT